MLKLVLLCLPIILPCLREARNRTEGMKCNIKVEIKIACSKKYHQKVLQQKKCSRRKQQEKKCAIFCNHLYLIEYYYMDAHVSLTKTIQNEWGFIQRVVVAKEHSFKPLTNALKNQFLQPLAGFTSDELDSGLMMKSGEIGGLGIQDPLKIAAICTAFPKKEQKY